MGFALLNPSYDSTILKCERRKMGYAAPTPHLNDHLFAAHDRNIEMGCSEGSR